MALHIWDEKVRSSFHRQRGVVRSLSVRRSQVLWVPGTVALAVLGTLLRAMYLTGRAMRACRQPRAAMLAGINIPNMRTLAFGLSAALGALAGLFHDHDSL